MDITTASFEEFKTIVDWAGQEGWNPGINDARMYYDADPNGFFVGKVDGEIVAAISAVKYDAHFGFMGFYIVRPDMRGKGHGIAIWNHAVRYLRGCNIGLDGVVEQQENYGKSGFQLAYNNIRFEGVSQQYETQEQDVTIESIHAQNVDAVLEYEQPFFPADRSQFMRQWLTQDDAIALVAKAGATVVGCGVARPCRTGYKIGPLYCENADVAMKLWEELNNSLPEGKPVYIDIPDCNTSAMELVANLGLSKVFETARMYTGSQWNLPVANMFSVTSFEIG